MQALYSNSIVLAASYAKNDAGKDSGSRLAMGYAKDYSIPLAVIYDREKNENNEKYGLNRQIVNEDSSVYIVSADNIIAAARDTLLLKPKTNEKQAVQQSMI